MTSVRSGYRSSRWSIRVQAAPLSVPEGYFAGKLIQDSGLKGFTVGGAQVSEKHSGFVINKGNATAADVMELIRQVTAKVKEDTGVTMEPEVKQIGEF